MIFTTFALQTSWQVVLTPDKEESGKSGVTSETLKNCIDRIYYTYIYIYINDIINVIYLFYAYIWRYMYISIYIYIHTFMITCVYACTCIYIIVYIYMIYIYTSITSPKVGIPPKAGFFFTANLFQKIQRPWRLEPLKGGNVPTVGKEEPSIGPNKAWILGCLKVWENGPPYQNVFFFHQKAKILSC